MAIPNSTPIMIHRSHSHSHTWHISTVYIVQLQQVAINQESTLVMHDSSFISSSMSRQDQKVSTLPSSWSTARYFLMLVAAAYRLQVLEYMKHKKWPFLLPLSEWWSQLLLHIRASTIWRVRRLRCSLKTLPPMLKADSKATVVTGIAKISRVFILKAGKRVPAAFHQPRTSKYSLSLWGSGSSSK